MITLISINRPLTHSARKELAEFGIEETRDINDFGHWTEIDVDEKPPEEVLDRHELVVDEDPNRIFETPHGELVQIFDDKVISDGVEATIPPEEAIEHAESNGWEEQ